MSLKMQAFICYAVIADETWDRSPYINLHEQLAVLLWY